MNRQQNVRMRRHARDAAYFRAHPRRLWLVRETSPDEWEYPDGRLRGVEETHILIVYDRRRDQYNGMPFTPQPGVTPEEAAVALLLHNPPACWRV